MAPRQRTPMPGVGESKFFSDEAYFVFVEAFEGFYELKLQVFGESADIVVGFDELCSVFSGFDDVGIDGALDEETGVCDLGCFFFEDANEFFADDFSFLFGVGDAFESLEEAIFGVDVDES